MKSTTSKLIFLLSFVVFAILPLLLPSNTANGQVTLLEPDVPLSRGASTSEGFDLGIYFNNIFRVGIGIAGALAVIMIVVGGVTHMVSESASGKSEGTKMVTEALTGLFIALVAFILLQTINPALVRFDFVDTLNRVVKDAKESRTASSTQSSTPQADNEQEIRSRLSNGGIAINNPCPDGQNINCTNVGGLPEAGIRQLFSIRDACKSYTGSDCQIVITGGTEDGHQTHGQGKSIVDIRPTSTVNDYLLLGGRTSALSCGTTIRRGGSSFVWEPTRCRGSSGDHWHVKL